MKVPMRNPNTTIGNKTPIVTFVPFEGLFDSSITVGTIEAVVLEVKLAVTVAKL